MLKLPKAFCWTRIGSESGQSLDVILRRKELERKTGNGTFIWGIGNSLGSVIWKFVKEVKEPMVLFSKIKSQPKHVDTHPSKVFLWTSYIDKYNNIIELPKNALIFSRANGKKMLKTHHFALICKGTNIIEKEVWEDVKFNNLKNFDSIKNRIGYSQVTAIVRNNGQRHVNGLKYNVEFSATLVEPFFIKLIHPFNVPLAKFDELNKIFKHDDITSNNWKTLALDFRIELEKEKKFRSFYTQVKLPLSNSAF